MRGEDIRDQVALSAQAFGEQAQRRGARGEAHERHEVSGNFAFDDVHAWIGRWTRFQQGRRSTPGGEIVYDFESALMGTLLRVSAQEGDATFWSDSVAPLALLKEFIGRRREPEAAGSVQL